MGRNKKLNNINNNEIEKLAALGLTDVEMGYMLGVCEATINNYKKDEKFLESLKRGKLKADMNVIRKLYDKAVSGDTTAMIFWLKNRRPQDWRDRQEIKYGIEEAEVEVV